MIWKNNELFCTISEEYDTEYRKLYGTKNADKILYNISRSSSTLKFLETCKETLTIPNWVDFHNTVIMNLKYILASRTKIKYGAVVLFNIWLLQVNEKEKLLSDIDVERLYFSVINNSK